MFGLIAKVGQGIAIGVRVAWNIKGLIREIRDVIDLARKLWDKYDDLDDDAKKMVKELNDVKVKIQAMLGI